ncbi:MAG: hypothetical protein P4N60_22125 [Verrucomicrobiae bacterium]|nr:hypothetical protein [Verrucomicrobiae bacterium]
MLNNATTISPRPLGDVNSVMRDLDLDSESVRGLVDQGSLIAFDISSTKTERRDLRILTKSVEHYREMGGKKPLVMEWPEIFRLIMPHNNFFVRSMEIARGLNCERTHVANLIAAGHLFCSRKSKPGPGGSALVSRTSYESFLIGRLQ